MKRASELHEEFKNLLNIQQQHEERIRQFEARRPPAFDAEARREHRKELQLMYQEGIERYDQILAKLDKCEAATKREIQTSLHTCFQKALQ